MRGNHGDSNDDSTLVREAGALEEICAAIARAGRVAFDLEFVSADRYVPDLALFQLAFGDPLAPEVFAVDPLALDIAPLLDRLADPTVEVYAHAARQDLGLLWDRHRVVVTSFFDTQLAGAFAGVGDQVGYANMVHKLLGHSLDKGPQHTDWKRRPLSPRQVAYALDDVRYLLRMADTLIERLEGLGRTSWVREESAVLATHTAKRKPPEELFRQVGAHAALRPTARAILRELCAWREREALASNTPPSWLAPDSALVELAKRPPDSLAKLSRARGLGASTVKRHGTELLAAVERGANDRGDGTLPGSPPPRSLGSREQSQAGIAMAILHARAGEAEIPLRLVGGKSDVEALVLWATAEDRARDLSSGERLPALLTGWRRELGGDDALAWLDGKTALKADMRSPSGVVILDQT